MPTTRPDAGLYLHVPFCGTLCSYCHFARTATHDAVLRRRTVQAMRAELDLRRGACATLREGRATFATIYIGGGTPSILELDLFAELVDHVVGPLRRRDGAEFTVEANPESFTPVVATAWRDLGVNRVSLGVQSLDPDVLALLGRRCDPATARGALVVAADSFARVSADWILGPGVDTARLCDELDEAIDLGVSHLSLYILELHQGTPLARAVAAGQVRLEPDDATEARYLACLEHLDRRGFAQYEVSNVARPGCESRHNQAYWNRTPYLAIGPSASGFWGRRRYTNTASLPAYLEQVESGRLPEAEVDHLSAASRRLEAVVLPLRTTEGVPLSRLPAGALDLERGGTEGLWTVEGGRLRLTPRGFLRIDTIEARLARALG